VILQGFGYRERALYTQKSFSDSKTHKRVAALLECENAD
jgi:hypothetical protein